MTFTAAQLVERQKYLGASECSAALGMSQWFTPLELYQSKKGLGKPIETTIPMMVGTALEPVVLEIFERETGQKVTQRQALMTDPTKPWRRATVDGIAEDGGLVEAKTSGDFRGWGKGEDEVPLPYLYNIMHSFACVPAANHAYFPVLVGGRTYQLYRVERDDKLIDLVRVGEDDFWINHVQHSVPPAPINPADLKIMYPRDMGITKTASAQEALLISDLKGIKDEAKTLDKRQEAAEMLVKQLIGDAATLIGVDGAVLATWKTQARAEFITKASSFRVLRLK